MLLPPPEMTATENSSDVDVPEDIEGKGEVDDEEAESNNSDDSGDENDSDDDSTDRVTPTRLRGRRVE